MEDMKAEMQRLTEKLQAYEECASMINKKVVDELNSKIAELTERNKSLETAVVRCDQAKAQAEEVLRQTIQETQTVIPFSTD